MTVSYTHLDVYKRQVLDLSKGYWQISMTKQAQRYAAFVTPFGTYQPKRMPFGLKNAPFTFCKLIRELTSGIHKFVETYFDDIAVFSSFWEDHLIHLKKVFETLKKAGLTVKPTKCQFAKATVKYLGHLVGQGYRTPAEAKIKAIIDLSLIHI